MAISKISSDGLATSGIAQTNLAAGVAGTGPAFSAYNSAAQSISAGTATKIQCNTEIFDTASCFDTSTYRFTPTVAGYYQINGAITYAGTAALYSVIAFYKNGSVYKVFNNQRSNANYNCTVTSDIIYLNGTTDYVELYGWESTATSTVYGSTTTTFSGALVRAA